MKILQTIMFVGMVGYCCGFLTGCKEFNPMNFNECFKCKDGYYADAKKCKVCPGEPNTIKECGKEDIPAVTQQQLLN